MYTWQILSRGCAEQIILSPALLISYCFRGRIIKSLLCCAAAAAWLMIYYHAAFSLQWALFLVWVSSSSCVGEWVIFSQARHVMSVLVESHSCRLLVRHVTDPRLPAWNKPWQSCTSRGCSDWHHLNNQTDQYRFIYMHIAVAYNHVSESTGMQTKMCFLFFPDRYWFPSHSFQRGQKNNHISQMHSDNGSYCYSAVF